MCAEREGYVCACMREEVYVKVQKGEWARNGNKRREKQRGGEGRRKEDRMHRKKKVVGEVEKCEVFAHVVYAKHACRDALDNNDNNTLNIHVICG